MESNYKKLTAKITAEISLFYAILQHAKKIAASLEGKWMEPAIGYCHFCIGWKPVWICRP